MSSRRSCTPRSTNTSRTTASTSYLDDSTTSSRPATSRRPGTKTGTSTGATGDQQLICALTESRGISPTVGLAFVNLSTTEAVLCQISDNQTYVKTVHKLHVFDPSEILVPTTSMTPTKSKLVQVLEASLEIETTLTPIGRRYWDDTAGLNYVQRLAFREDVEAIKVSLGGNFFATSCLAATLSYVENILAISFAYHSMRIKYEASEGSMMIDLSTIQSLELIENIHKARSKDCLYGLLNQTLTPMGGRLLRSNILQPLTGKLILEKRYDALEEFTTRDEIFYAVRQALKGFVDVDRVLTNIVVIPSKPSVQYWEQCVNNVILVKQYVKSIPAVFEALGSARSELLRGIRESCRPEIIKDVQYLIDAAINEDVTYQKKPLDLRNQRTYAVKAGVNGLLDVARQTYKEANQDAFQQVEELSDSHKIGLELKFDVARGLYITLPASELEDRDLPAVFVNVFRKKNMIECQTLDLVKLNQKITDSHHEVLHMSLGVVQDLIEDIRDNIAPLFKISDSIAVLDMLASLAQVATTQDYCRPEITSTLAIKDGRHPMREKIQAERYIPNDVYAAPQSRLQIITGCNMSGKSTYIRSIALQTIMCQIGSFIPASYASFPIRHQLFARISLDDSSTSNISTFAAEMRETAFILRNIDARSLVIIDELGRGTSTRDGICIAIAVAEALVQSKALVWFVTHFRDLSLILAERPGVVNLHLAADTMHPDRMKMLYRIEAGPVDETHYGIALAKATALPSPVIEVAERVAAKLVRSKENRRRTSKAVVQARKRKLVLGLREQLVQAKEGEMKGEVLRCWLKRLQDEFVIRMSELDDAERSAGRWAIEMNATEDASSMVMQDDGNGASDETALLESAHGLENGKGSAKQQDQLSTERKQTPREKSMTASTEHQGRPTHHSEPAEHENWTRNAQLDSKILYRESPTNHNVATRRPTSASTARESTYSGDKVRSPTPDPHGFVDPRYMMSGAL